jgi:hypothetical protein
MSHATTPLKEAKTLAKSKLPFTLSKGKLVFPFRYDMYGLYDRMGEGVMYSGLFVFDPAFFTPSAKPWDPSLLSLELVGFSSSSVSYLERYSANAKAWEKRLLSFWASDLHNFINECLFENLNTSQCSLVDAPPHSASMAAGTHLKPLAAILKLAAKNSPHK